MMTAGHRALARRVIEGRVMPCQAWREVGLRRVEQCSQGYDVTVIGGFALVARRGGLANVVGGSGLRRDGPSIRMVTQ